MDWQRQYLPVHLQRKREDLVRYLRCQRGRYRRKRGTKIREKQREELKKKRIDVRSDTVVARQRIEDWEGDTILGQDRRPGILTHCERKSGLILIDKLESINAEIAKQKTIQRFKIIPQNKKHTLTYDNSPEFSEYEILGIRAIRKGNQV